MIYYFRKALSNIFELLATDLPRPHAFINLALHSTCSHTTDSYCQICVESERQNFCIHQWYKLNQQIVADIFKTGVQNCDFTGTGRADQYHPAIKNANSEVYMCKLCQAIACSNCYLGSSINTNASNSNVNRKSVYLYFNSFVLFWFFYLFF